tara:strand:+ start:116 stop:235 length:120 start_codon:yes stop_codon:yes gene_type:complete
VSQKGNWIRSMSVLLFYGRRRGVLTNESLFLLLHPQLVT